MVNNNMQIRSIGTQQQSQQLQSGNKTKETPQSISKETVIINARGDYDVFNAKGESLRLEMTSWEGSWDQVKYDVKMLVQDISTPVVFLLDVGKFLLGVETRDKEKNKAPDPKAKEAENVLSKAFWAVLNAAINY